MKLKVDPNTMEDYPVPPDIYPVPSDMSNNTFSVIYHNGTKACFCNQKYHNLEGPAVEYLDGHKEYWIDDIQYSFKEWDRLRKLMIFK